ncbi:MAG: stage 0 sporulation family protein [Armatimonadota bacterium]|nr:stage 0 sporulation family protein [Armatimonadota bacterium]
MPLVVGVCFKKVGKIYYFDPAGLDLQEGDFVIAETARGTELGQVMTEIREVPEEEIVPPLRSILRKATPEDFEREESNRQKEEYAFQVCAEKIQKHNLPMKLIEADYSFDGSQVTFYFAAETRVDFRELVKDLASTLRIKVQLHQVGVRDEAKFFGGLGMCGRALCCATFLKDFEPVSMKMAKEQSLFLNPIKFSGICGKLMCCLKFEYPIYKEAKSRLPAVGSTVMTPRGPGKVTEVNIIKEMLTIDFGEGIIGHYPASEVKVVCTLSKEGNDGVEDEQRGAEFQPPPTCKCPAENCSAHLINQEEGDFEPRDERFQEIPSDYKTQKEQ